MRMLFAALCIVHLAACHSTGPSRQGEVSLAAVEPDDAPKFILAPDQRFVFGEPVGSTLVLPTYPPEYLAAQLPPLNLCIELETNVDGHVVAARPLDLPGTCEALSDPAQAAVFEAAVRHAVMQWRYLPSLLCKGVSPGARLPPDGCGDAVAEPVPLLRAYRFVFVQRSGEASVSVGEAPPR